MYAEIFDPSSRFSLNSLNIDGMIISNEMVALYIAQVLTHPKGHKFYEDLLIKNFESEDTVIDFDVRKASELISSTFRFFLQDKTYNCSFVFVFKMVWNKRILSGLSAITQSMTDNLCFN